MSRIEINKKRPSMMDVAKLAGVVHSTVSRVINNNPNIGDATRQRVLDAIRMTGYRPSLAAQILARQKHETIGLVFEREHVKTYYGACLIEGVSEKLAESGQRLAMGMIPWQSQAEEIEKLPLLRSVSVDGLILDINHIEGDWDSVAARLGLPYISINNSGYRDYNMIKPDDVSVAREATQYLIDRGHRKIAYLPCPGTLRHSSQTDRMKGYADAMLKADLPPIPLWDVPLEKVEYPAEDYLFRTKLFKEKYECTAIVAFNATEAPRLLYAAYELGLRIPRDLSLVACDFDPAIRFLPVPITCFQFDRTQMGRLVVDMLAERINNSGKAIPSILFKGTLVEGVTGLYHDGNSK
jgi:LacI family transcriptional regulator